HRDVKPSNVFLTPSDDAKIGDFGIARLEQPDATLTLAGQAFGSPPYMSPEQAMGGKVDARSDLYSLGCVLFQIIAGTPPFSGEGARAAAQAMVARSGMDGRRPRAACDRDGRPPGRRRSHGRGEPDRASVDRFVVSIVFAIDGRTAHALRGRRGAARVDAAAARRRSDRPQAGVGHPASGRRSRERERARQWQWRWPRA